MNEETEPLHLPESESFEDNVRRRAEIHEQQTKAGEGFFFDFDLTPEYKSALINWLTHYYGWSVEYDGTFMRKPKSKSSEE